MFLLSSGAFCNMPPATAVCSPTGFSPIYIEIASFGSCGSEGRAVNGVAVLLRWRKNIGRPGSRFFPLSPLFIIEEERGGGRGVWKSSLGGGGAS